MAREKVLNDGFKVGLLCIGFTPYPPQPTKIVCHEIKSDHRHLARSKVSNWTYEYALH
jgi:hypothetical protein